MPEDRRGGRQADRRADRRADKRADTDREFTAYVTARAPALRRTAYLLCGDWHRAEDLTQSALARLYLAWSRARRTGAVDRYARKIVVRVFLDERRRMWRREVPTADLPESAIAGPTSEDRLVVLEALNLVPDRQRAALVLRYWEDLSIGETAEVLGCSEGNVKSQTARGLAALRSHLNRRGYRVPDLEESLR
jgi:RNA polymerase sigma-70 factor (sigma-E family)